MKKTKMLVLTVLIGAALCSCQKNDDLTDPSESKATNVKCKLDFSKAEMSTCKAGGGTTVPFYVNNIVVTWSVRNYQV